MVSSKPTRLPYPNGQNLKYVAFICKIMNIYRLNLEYLRYGVIVHGNISFNSKKEFEIERTEIVRTNLEYIAHKNNIDALIQMMAEVYEEMVEKLVIVSSGIVYTEDRKMEHMKTIGRNVVDLLVPKTPEDIRTLCQLTIQKFDLGKWIPEFFLWGLIYFECCGKEKEELVLELLNEKPDVVYPVLTQETLLIWGDKDVVFPPDFGHQLHRHLGGKSKIEIIKNVGHAANFEAPFSLNRFITSFVSASC